MPYKKEVLRAVSSLVAEVDVASWDCLVGQASEEKHYNKMLERKVKRVLCKGSNKTWRNVLEGTQKKAILLQPGFEPGTSRSLLERSPN